MKPSAFTGLLLGSLLIFSLLGYFIDTHIHTTPLFICLGVAYSIFGSFYLLLRKRPDQDE